jgi:hypothetical protein
MLQILNPETTIETVRPAVRPRPVRRHVFSTIAKARHQPAHVRSDFAARWLTGALTLKPTWDLARHIFRVHGPQIRDALARLEASTVAEPAITHAWADARPAEKADFVKTHLAEIWRLVDRATAA